MTRPNKPDDGNVRLAAIERRLKALEVGGRAEHTTMQGGLFRIRDVDGDLRAAMGDLDGDEQAWGFEVVQGGMLRLRDPDGTIRLVLGDVDATAAYGMELHRGGIIRIRDALDEIRAAIGDLDGDGTLYGFEVTRGGVMAVRDGDGDVRALIGDVDDDGTTYGIDLRERGLMRVRDATDTVRATVGDLNDNGTVYGVRVLEEGRIEVVRGGAMSVIDESDNVRITIGDPNNTGEYWVTVNDGGEVVVNDGGEVVVEDGGQIRMAGGGQFFVGDESNTIRVFMGDTGTARGHSLDVYDPDGFAMLSVDDEGMRHPFLTLSWRDPYAFRTITPAAGYEITSAATCPFVSHLGFECRVGWQADAGVTGNIKISTFSGDSDAIAVDGGGAGGFGTAVFRWLHPYDIGDGPVRFHVYAEQTAGAGALLIFEPDLGAMVDPSICTAGGT